MENKDKPEYREYLDDINYQLNVSFRSRNKIKVVLKLYIYFGLLLFIVGGLYFVLSLVQLNLSIQQRTMLITSGVGLFLSLTAKVYLEYLNERGKEIVRKESELQKASKLLISWAGLERTLNKFIESKNLSDNKFAISKNLDIALKEKAISSKDFLVLERSLDLRNQLMHGKMLATSDVDNLSSLLESITEKLLDQIVSEKELNTEKK